jgi:predicted DNA-binding transcriptional regulator AlpA
MTNYTFMTVRQFCERVAIDRRTWDNWQDRGITPRYRKTQTGRIMIAEADYEAWVESLMKFDGLAGEELVGVDA